MHRITLNQMANKLHQMNSDIDSTWITDNKNFDPEILLATILQYGEDFGVLYERPSFFKYQSDMWFLKHKRAIEDLFNAFDIPYSPLENYSRKETTVSKTTESDSEYNRFKNNDAVTDTHLNEKSYDESVSGATTKGSTTGETMQGLTSGSTSNDKTNTVNETSSQDTTTYNQEVVDDDGTSKLRAPGSNGQNYSETTNTVSAFDSSSYQPHDKSKTETYRSEDTTTTDDKTTTNNGSENLSADKITTDVETEKENVVGTEDRKTDTLYDESGTMESTKNVGETSNASDTSMGEHTGDSQKTGKSDRDFQNSSYISGNIGTMTSQNMLTEEVRIRLFDIYQTLAEMYVDELCVCIYLNRNQRGGCPYGY